MCSLEAYLEAGKLGSFFVDLMRSHLARLFKPLSKGTKRKMYSAVLCMIFKSLGHVHRNRRPGPVGWRNPLCNHWKCDAVSGTLFLTGKFLAGLKVQAVPDGWDRTTHTRWWRTACVSDEPRVRVDIATEKSLFPVFVKHGASSSSRLLDIPTGQHNERVELHSFHGKMPPQPCEEFWWDAGNFRLWPSAVWVPAEPSSRMEHSVASDITIWIYQRTI